MDQGVPIQFIDPNTGNPLQAPQQQPSQMHQQSITITNGTGALKRVEEACTCAICKRRVGAYDSKTVKNKMKIIDIKTISIAF